MPLQETSGAATYDAFGGGPAAAVKHVEDYFQTWLRTGTGASATVTTGLNASINKSLVWTKSRSAATDHKFTDTVRGATKALVSNSTAAETTDSQGLTAFSSTGYTIGTNTTYNNSGATYVDWQFVATPKFFDVVTYTGTGAAQTINHNLGSVPGCIIIKTTSTNDNWRVYHRSTGNQYVLTLNSDIGQIGPSAAHWNNTDPTATQFTVGTNGSQSSTTYVAYLFAHNAGGFGASGTDNVISCGSFTTDGAGYATVTLGYEPQWVLYKRTTGTQDWIIMDNLRGSSYTVNNALKPNNSNAEQALGEYGIIPTSTGFINNYSAGAGDFIYIAIRRGPMRTPTTGTSVFSPNIYTEIQPNPTLINAGFPPDFTLQRARNQDVGLSAATPRLTRNILSTNATGTEAAYGANDLKWDQMLGVSITSLFNNTSGRTDVVYSLQRAPGFFDVVCLNSTTSAAQVISHNLGVAPQIIISKRRNGVSEWQTMDATNYLRLNTDSPDLGVPTYHTFTATTFSIDAGACSSGENWVFYLFASCPGVSKVGSYTGTGTTLQVNCGFTGGARFVLIKRTDSTGDWYVWDSARGIVAGNDPYLLLNSTAAEVTSTDYVDTFSSGFEISSTAPAAINANGGTFIYLAIA